MIVCVRGPTAEEMWKTSGKHIELNKFDLSKEDPKIQDKELRTTGQKMKRCLV